MLFSEAWSHICMLDLSQTFTHSRKLCSYYVKDKPWRVVPLLDMAWGTKRKGISGIVHDLSWFNPLKLWKVCLELHFRAIGAKPWAKRTFGEFAREVALYVYICINICSLLLTINWQDFWKFGKTWRAMRCECHSRPISLILEDSMAKYLVKTWLTRQSTWRAQTSLAEADHYPQLQIAVSCDQPGL